MTASAPDVEAGVFPADLQNIVSTTVWSDRKNEMSSPSNRAIPA